MTDDELYKKLKKQYDRNFKTTLKIVLAKIADDDVKEAVQYLLEQEREYWLTRLSLVDEYHFYKAVEAAQIVSAPYTAAAHEYTQEIKRIYGTYKGAFGLSKSQADKLLRTVNYDRSIMDNLRKIADSLPPGDQKNLMYATISAPAYRFRMQRADVMCQQAAQTCRDIARGEIVTDRAVLQTATEQAYNITLEEIIGKSPADTVVEAIKEQITTEPPITSRMPGVQDIIATDDRGVMASFTELNTDAVREIVNHNWYGENFSDRVWENTDEVAKEIKGVLIEGEMTGASVDQMAAKIQERFDVAAYKARRLVRTEYNYCTNQATLRGYQNAEIDKYRYLAIIDDRTSEICTDLDGEIFLVSDATVGVNYPPMHPNCRSTTVPVLQTAEEIEAEIEAIVDSWNIPEGMSFDDFVDKSFEEILKRRGLT